MFEAIIANLCIVPVSLVLSVIQVESAGNPRAFLEDKRGLTYSSYGLMQVTFATAKELNCGVKQPHDLFNPETNIKCGCTYLSNQFNRYKSWDAAIVAYNQGSVLINGKPVLNHTGLTEQAMKGVERNIYRKKVLKHFTN